MSSPELSELARRHYLAALREAFGGMLDRLDDALFDLAERSDSEEVRGDYFEVMRGMRTTREELENEFLGTIERVWDGGDAPSSATAEQAENMALSLAVRYAEGECADELALLRRRLMPQVAHPRGVQQALAPRILFGAFEYVCAGLQAGVPVRMVLLKFFERHVGAELRGIYQRMLDLLEGSGGALQTLPAAAADSDLPAAGAPQPDPVLGGADIGSVVNRLVRGERPGPVEVLKLLATQQSDAGGVFSRTASFDLARYGDDSATAVSGVDLAVDMMALLYDGSYGDPGLSPFIKVQLARLQLPLLKVALRDPGFLSRRSHPARRFFSAVLALGRARGQAIEPSEEGRLNALVDQVAERCVEDPAIFETALATLMATAPAAAGGAGRDVNQVEIAEREAQRAIEQRRAGHDVPDVIATFLVGHWQRHLVDVYLRHGRDSAAWWRAVGTAEALIWAVTAPETPDNRARLAELRARLVRQLRGGLEELGVPSAQQEVFYARLREIIDAALYMEPPAQEIDLADLEADTDLPPIVSITNSAGVAVSVIDDDADADSGDAPAGDAQSDAQFLADQEGDFDDDADADSGDAPAGDTQSDAQFLADQEGDDPAGPIEVVETGDAEISFDAPDGPPGGAAEGGGAPDSDAAPGNVDPVAELLRRRGMDADTLVIEEIVLEGHAGADGGRLGKGSKPR